LNHRKESIKRRYLSPITKKEEQSILSPPVSQQISPDVTSSSLKFVENTLQNDSIWDANFIALRTIFEVIGGGEEGLNSSNLNLEKVSKEALDLLEPVLVEVYRGEENITFHQFVKIIMDAGECDQLCQIYEEQ